jgi:hypothetical protein
LDNRLRQRRKIVSIRGDVERADRNCHFLDPLDHLSDALGKKHTPAADSNQAKVPSAVIFFDYFVHQAH